MLNSIIQFSNRPAVRNSCLNGGIYITIFLFSLSILSCFVLLYFLAGVLWATVYLVCAAVVSSLYIDWLRRAPPTPHMIPISTPYIAGQAEAVGLDASAIAALPSFQYQRYCKDSSNDTDGNGWVQCAICIGTVQIGEMVRNLPACKHLFHVECIDMWLSSQSTCPMCRATVAVSDETEPEPPV